MGDARRAKINADAMRRAKQRVRQKRRARMQRLAPPAQLWLCLCFFACILYLECMARLLSESTFFGVGLLYIALFSASLALLCTALCCLLPPKAGYVAAAVLLGLLTLFYIVQVFYNSIFQTYVTLFSIFNGTQALQFGETIWSQFTRMWPYVLCMMLPFVAFLVFGRKLKLERTPAAALVALTGAVVMHITGLLALPVFGTGLFTPHDYYYSSQPLDATADKLGLYTALRLDAKHLLFGEPQKTPMAPPASSASSSVPPVSSSAASPLPGGTSQPKPEPEPELPKGDNVLDIDFEALAAAETDSTLQEMHRYFGGLQPTAKNEYTGMFEGYNLILVVAESFAPYAVDALRTPTLYGMMNGGMQFSEYYIPLWGTSTLDGEYAICQGLVPKQGVWSMSQAGKNGNALPFTLGNQLLAQGYQSYAYHNHNAEYYDRRVSHPAMGYEFKALDAGLEVSRTWPESDLEMVDLTSAEYMGDDPFHVYYLTVSGHMPYETYNAMAKKNWDAVADLDLSTAAKAYLACNIELDKAMELLLQRLNEAGIAEKTVIALTSDHPPYPLQTKGMSELLGHQVERRFEYYRNSFFVYCQGMQPQVVDKPCGALDILPTLSNLFGLPYDSRLLAGRDILSDAEPLVILADRSWVTDRARFNANNGTLTVFEGQEADEAYVAAIHQQVADRFTYSARILDKDYYAVLQNAAGLPAAAQTEPSQ